MSIDNFEIKGLTDKQVLQSRASYGQNKLVFKKENIASVFEHFHKVGITVKIVTGDNA